MKLHFVLLDTVDTLRRRKYFFLLPLLSVLLLGVGVAYLLPSEFESHSTLLFQRDVAPAMQNAPVARDPIETTEELLYSRVTLGMLADSLSMDVADMAGLERIRKQIHVVRRSEDSFRIIASANTPETAYRMAGVLTDLYLQTRLKIRARELEDAIQFYEGRVEEYRRAFEEQQRDLQSSNQARLRAAPQGEESYRFTLSRVEGELGDLDRDIQQQERTNSLLQSYTLGVDSPRIVSQISSLPSDGSITYITELKSLSVRYNQLRDRYTPRYPEVQSVRKQLLSLLEKSREAVEAEISQKRELRSGLVTRRNRLLQDISSSITFDGASEERRTDYRMYKELYEGMRLQLEQARIARDHHEKVGSGVTVLDQPQVPSAPVKPDRTMIISIAAILGLLCGVCGVFIGDLLDPTIRRPRDLEIFQKPIIAHLP